MSAARALADGHLKMLKASAISEEVALARGYWTACKRSELRDLGFVTVQQIVPALVVPIWGVTGEIVNYQSRPDTPRIDPERGREIKYETVAGSSIRLDVPPPCRPRVGYPNGALWITEGCKKADALASAGLTAISLLGVDCFKSDDWDRVPLEDRRVYVAYDSDVMVKPSVYSALERIQKYLAARGADVSFVYLPTTVGKIGVDDYLANGASVEQLSALAEDELREPPSEEKPKRAAALPTAYLLNTIARLFCRFVRFPSEHEPAVLALFALHTWAVEAARATPYLLVISPEKKSGKTRSLEVAELVVRDPVRAGNISAAGVFQAIEKWTPTLLVDELDAVFRSKSEQAEALRGVLNAGNRRGSHVIRGSQDGEPVRFGTFCAKAMAGINTGRLPDTIRDRSIVLSMERRRPGEMVEDLFPDDLADQLAELRMRLEDWAAENTERLKAWRRPDRVAGLDDRLQEAWDPLLAIADLARAGWPEKSRQAATALAKDAEDAGDAAHGHLLIETLRTFFDADGSALASKAICQKLNEDEELPFGGYSAEPGSRRVISRSYSGRTGSNRRRSGWAPRHLRATTASSSTRSGSATPRAKKTRVTGRRPEKGNKGNKGNIAMPTGPGMFPLFPMFPLWEPPCRTRVRRAMDRSRRSRSIHECDRWTARPTRSGKRGSRPCSRGASCERPDDRQHWDADRREGRWRAARRAAHLDSRGGPARPDPARSPRPLRPFRGRSSCSPGSRNRRRGPTYPQRHKERPRRRWSAPGPDTGPTKEDRCKTKPTRRRSYGTGSLENTTPTLTARSRRGVAVGRRASEASAADAGRVGELSEKQAEANGCAELRGRRPRPRERPASD